MTVKELIEKLKEFPEDMPVGIMYDVHSDIEIHIATWTHDNYPYNKPDFDYVNIN
jgi:hypothetical protein